MGQGPRRGGNGCDMERPCEITRSFLYDTSIGIPKKEGEKKGYLRVI